MEECGVGQASWGSFSCKKRLCIEPWLYINYLSMVQYDLTYSVNYFFMDSCVGFGMGGEEYRQHLGRGKYIASNMELFTV